MGSKQVHLPWSTQRQSLATQHVRQAELVQSKLVDHDILSCFYCAAVHSLYFAHIRGHHRSSKPVHQDVSQQTSSIDSFARHGKWG